VGDFTAILGGRRSCREHAHREKHASASGGIPDSSLAMIRRPLSILRLSNPDCMGVKLLWKIVTKGHWRSTLSIVVCQFIWGRRANMRCLLAGMARNIITCRFEPGYVGPIAVGAGAIIRGSWSMVTPLSGDATPTHRGEPHLPDRERCSGRSFVSGPNPAGCRSRSSSHLLRQQDRRSKPTGPPQHQGICVRRCEVSAVAIVLTTLCR